MSVSQTFQQWFQEWLGITDIQRRMDKMADVLDQALADLNQLVTDANALIADFNSEASGQISTSDPRWQTLTSTMSQLDSSIKAALPVPASPAPQS